MLPNNQFYSSSNKNNAMALFFILFHILIIYITASCFYYFFGSLTISSFIYYIFAIIFVSTRMRALGNILHECSHFSYSPSKKSNIFFGNLVSILELSSFKSYQVSHVFHHKYLGVEEKDDDYRKYLKLVKPFRHKKIYHNFFMLFLFIVFNPINWVYYISNSICFFEKNIYIVTIKFLYFISLIFLCTFISPSKFMLFLIVPYFTFYQAMKISSDLLDHHKVYFNKDYLFKTRNHIFKYKILNLIFFPRNDAYHLVHHMCPRAPVKDLAKIHQDLLVSNKKYAFRKHYLF